MHYRPFSVLLGVITYYEVVIVFRFILLEKLLTPYFLENRMHRFSFLLSLLGKRA